MNLNRLMALTVFASAALLPQGAPRPKSDVQTQWQAVDQLCGQLELTTPTKKHIIVDGKPEVRLYTAYLEGATVTLHPATSGDKECCAGQPVATTRSRKYGAFELDGVQPGNYRLRVQKDDLVRQIPIRITENFDRRACHDASVARSIMVDSSPPKIQTRIR